MLSISPPKRAPETMAYFARHLRPAIPEAERDHPKGQWLRAGAAALGLHGDVTAQALARCLAGWGPANIPLVRNAGDPERRGGWDLVLSAPKSVSILWALSEPALSARIAAAHQAAVERAVEFIETHHAIGRRGKGGRVKEKAKLVVARFAHYTSRENDPQLHDHTLHLNLACFDDGHWGALEPRPIFQAQLAIGALYRVELAHRIRMLGFPVKQCGDGFRVETVPTNLERIFSRRRQQVEAMLERHQDHSAKAAEIATLASRPPKQEIPLPELRHLWQVRAAIVGVGPGQAAAWRTGRGPAPVSISSPPAFSATEVRDQAAFFATLQGVCDADEAEQRWAERQDARPAFGDAEPGRILAPG